MFVKIGKDGNNISLLWLFDFSLYQCYPEQGKIEEHLKVLV